MRNNQCRLGIRFLFKVNTSIERPRCELPDFTDLIDGLVEFAAVSRHQFPSGGVAYDTPGRIMRVIILALAARVAAGVDCSSWDGDPVGCSGCVATGECVYNERTSLCETVADTEKCPAGDFGPTGGEECDVEDLKCEMFSDECSCLLYTSPSPRD